MSKDYQRQVCLENIEKILRRLSSFVSRQASFAYRQGRHSWLAAGVHPHVESAVLQEALRLIGVPFEVTRSKYRGRSYRSVVTVLDVPTLKERLRELEREGRLYDVLEEAYRRATQCLFGRGRGGSARTAPSYN